ncbi:helix-turn-helix domain-containing protein [Phenylobacterium montanum]|uniref:Helix-turn-helix domain-containing protein n=1 Tax=Phenylobacterium montanum TaxID=2823693 RepID=A0A975FWU8_9CAUL|nr:helix-turn-helix domain-containing protein [Caulobacter sp. S6]QUD86953.1 helix-turn-helix domain-containing protein [Caulobacter sp. S6]
MLNSSDAPTKEAYRISEASAAYGLGKTKLYELISSGQLPSIKVGRRRLVLRSGLDALMKGAA